MRVRHGRNAAGETVAFSVTALAETACADAIDLSYPSGATFHDPETHRYVLWRTWARTDDGWPSPGRMCAFIGLNPSTADENDPDPTVTRCINRAKSLGYGGMFMLNLFAYRETEAALMRKHPEPVGPFNDMLIRHVCGISSRIICCWGAHGSHLGRSAQVKEWLLPLFREKLDCLGRTQAGEPKHPLYLRSDLVPERFAD